MSTMYTRRTALTALAWHRRASCRMFLKVLRIFCDRERVRYRVFDRKRYRIRLPHRGGNHHR